MDVEREIEALKRQVSELRRKQTRTDHWHNTMHSPWWKRLVWWLMGFRLLALGTWYRARWNESARKYD